MRSGYDNKSEVGMKWKACGNQWHCGLFDGYIATLEERVGQIYKISWRSKIIIPSQCDGTLTSLSSRERGLGDWGHCLSTDLEACLLTLDRRLSMFPSLSLGILISFEKSSALLLTSYLRKVYLSVGTYFPLLCTHEQDTGNCHFMASKGDSHFVLFDQATNKF